MATAYVSPVGSAAYPGTVGAPTSLTTALSSAGAGDIVYLAPGSYRGTFTLGVSGTAGNTIQFIGDPQATQTIGGIAAGVVRVTNYLNDAANPTAAILLTVSSRNHWSFTNIYFEAYQTGTYAFSLATSTNWSFEKCFFLTRYSRGFTITTTANVAQNATFNKCIFNTSAYAIDINGANHTENYSLNMSITDCVSYKTFLQTFNGSAGTNTNAGGISIYNLTVLDGFGTQIYQSNTVHPITVYNSVVLNMSGSYTLFNNISGAVVENYNLLMGVTNSVTAGANSLYVGSFGLDYGYSAIVGLPAPSIIGPYLGSRLLGAGTATGAPATDIDGVAWYQSLLGMGAYTYAARNNVIAFPLTPTQTTITVAPASTSQSIELLLGATGLTFATSGLTAYYILNRSSPVQISLISQTPTGSWASGGFAEISSANAPGVYRLDVPDAAFVSGYDDVTIVVRGASGTNGAVVNIRLNQLNVSQLLNTQAGIYTSAGTLGARLLQTVSDNRPVIVTSDNQIQVDAGQTFSSGSGTTILSPILNSVGRWTLEGSTLTLYNADGTYLRRVNLTQLGLSLSPT